MLPAVSTAREQNVIQLAIEGIYLGGWATSAKGSVTEDPGPDLASYPLSQVPDEAAPIVRALLTADRNQRFARSRLGGAQRAASPEVDDRPFVIAAAAPGPAPETSWFPGAAPLGPGWEWALGALCAKPRQLGLCGMRGAAMAVSCQI